MAVAVKEYLDTMRSVSSTTAAAPAKPSASDLKLQSLLSQLIEAISYANSIDFKQKTLNQQAPGTADKGETGKQVLENMKAQEKLVKQLADGQKLSNAQTKELNATIDKFYELIGTQEVNYKKFAATMEKFALQGNLPEAVQTRLINDSRDAHIIGQEQKNDAGVIMPILKRIRNLLEDGAENTKQFTKKLFVSLDTFKAGLLGAFEELADKIAEGGIGGLLDNIANMINMTGMAWMAFSQMFKEGDFKWGQAFKQIENIKKAGKTLGGFGKIFTTTFKNVEKMFTTLSRLPKFIQKFDKLKGIGGGVMKAVSKGLGKTSLKKIPVIGSLMSIWMAVNRWNNKDYLGAFLELGSGIAAIFPGLGTLISVGIDLINFERDTKSISSFINGQVEKAGINTKSLGENLLMSIPGIGPIYGLAKAIGMFQKGDKKGGLKMLGKSIASIVPGGAFLADLLYKLMDMSFDLKPKQQPVGNTPEATELINKINTKPNAKYKIKKQKPGTSGTKVEDFEWEEQKGSSDISPVPASMQLGAGNDSTFGDNLAQAAIARGGGTTKSGGYCALAVGDAFSKVVGEKEASKYRGNAWTWISKLKGIGSKWFNNAGVAKNNRELSRIPAGSIAVWDKQPAHPYGHIEIADGRGHLISDFKRPANLGLYRRNPAGIKPVIFTPKDKPMPKLTGVNNPFGQDETSMAGDSFDGTGEDVEAPATFEGLMDAFNKFNESLVEGVEAVPGSATPVANSQTPSTEELTAGTPAAATASATATTAEKVKSAPPVSTQAPMPQMQQATNSDSAPSTMDTEIRDTDLALLNSILFN